MVKMHLKEGIENGLFYEYVRSVFVFLPIILLALLLRWIRIIRINSEIQIEQNKKIILLLKEQLEKNKYLFKNPTTFIIRCGI